MMGSFGSTARELYPGLGFTSYISGESCPDTSWLVAFPVSLFANLETWYGQLGFGSRLLFFTFLVSTFAASSSWYAGRLNRNIMLLPLILLATLSLTQGQDSATTTTTALDSTYTLPPDADVGQQVIPNIVDPQAVNPQLVCPGYKASNVKSQGNALTADLTLAGEACNVYGTDIESLSLFVEYQAADRLHIQIQPRHIGPENYTWFILPDELIPAPQVESEDESDSYPSDSDLDFAWKNEPTFSFEVVRKSTGDVLFTTGGTQLVYEDQFIEFGSYLPDNYNLYGLGEVIHGFRLGNNLTRMTPNYIHT